MTLDSDAVEKEIISLIEKYYPSFLLREENLFSEDVKVGEKGFYLFFVKRDETKKDRLSVYTFGGEIKINDIIEAFSAKVYDMLRNSSKEIPVA